MALDISLTVLPVLSSSYERPTIAHLHGLDGRSIPMPQQSRCITMTGLVRQKRQKSNNAAPLLLHWDEDKDRYPPIHIKDWMAHRCLGREGYMSRVGEKPPWTTVAYPRLRGALFSLLFREPPSTMGRRLEGSFTYRALSDCGLQEATRSRKKFSCENGLNSR